MHRYSDELWKDLGKKCLNYYGNEVESPVYRKVGPLMYKLSSEHVGFEVLMGKWIVLEETSIEHLSHNRLSWEENLETIHRYRLELKEFANEYIKLFHGLKDIDFISEEMPERDIIDEVFVPTA
jgi:hypothetical protein